MKVNVDEAISKNMRRPLVTAIARDPDGIFLGVSGVVLDGITEVEIAEVMACREGLALGNDLMLTSVRLASDCATVVRRMEGRNMNPYGQIVKEIQTKTHDFVLVDFVHENRKSNVDAHTLARSLISFDTGRHVWF
jgi:ribonuclease HI